MYYNNLSSYFKRVYNGRIKKICIDGGFSCPNRDGKCGFGGCIFCGERGSGEHIESARLSISDQVIEYFSKNPKADGFIAYFQNFTNTDAPVIVLKERYDAALIDDRIVALAIGTRPDCITEENADLLMTYKSKYDVWVELGLQTSNDNTAILINRGYDHNAFEQAVEILSRRNIPIVVHIIVGLPGESFHDIKNTVNYINKFNLWGIKIHSIYVMHGTVLEQMYLEGEFYPLSLKEYVDSVAYILSHISPDMIVHRITGDCPAGMLVAPEWNSNKNKIIDEINRTMKDNGLSQGCFFREED